MRAYFKCPACGGTEEFRLDVLNTSNWNALEGYQEEISSPQVKKDYYISCRNKEDCDQDGTVEEFWAGDPEWMQDGMCDELFLHDLHQEHKGG